MAIQAFQEGTDAVDEAASAALGVGRTDLRILSILDRRGELAMGTLTAAAGLSKPAMTAAIDRLERAGLVRRMPSAIDRRSAMVVLTDEARTAIAEIYGPLGAAAPKILARYSVAELELVAGFVRAAESLQAEHAARIRDLPLARGRPRSSARRRRS